MSASANLGMRSIGNSAAAQAAFTRGLTSDSRNSRSASSSFCSSAGSIDWNPKKSAGRSSSVMAAVPSLSSSSPASAPMLRPVPTPGYRASHGSPARHSAADEPFGRGGEEEQEQGVEVD